MDLKWKAFKERPEMKSYMMIFQLIQKHMERIFCLNMNMIKMILTDNGWINAKSSSELPIYNTFKPNHFFSSQELEADV